MSVLHSTTRCILLLDAKSETTDTLLRERAEDIGVRLRIWAGGVGVFASRDDAIDCRLRNNCEVLDLLLVLLNRLCELLDRAFHVPSKNECVIEAIEEEDEALESDSSESSSSAGSADQGLDSPTQDPLSKANAVVDDLYKLSRVIRRRTPSLSSSSQEKTKLDTATLPAISESDALNVEWPSARHPTIVPEDQPQASRSQAAHTLYGLQDEFPLGGEAQHSTPHSIGEYVISDANLLPLQPNLSFPSWFYPLTRRANANRVRSEKGDDDSTGIYSSRSSMRSSNRSSARASSRTDYSMSFPKSLSPSSSFLMRYKDAETVMKPPEPDDEGQSIGDEYVIGKQIGFGGFSTVKEAHSVVEGRSVVHAVKIVRKSKIEEPAEKAIEHEVEIWRFMRHPHILPLLKVYETDFATFCIMKRISGGTLFDLIRETRRTLERGLSEDLTKRYASQLASALRYLHEDVQVVHHDVKLENIFIDTTGPSDGDEGGNIVLSDFGQADFQVPPLDSEQPKVQNTSSSSKTHQSNSERDPTLFTGSLQYAAPEVLNATGPLHSPAVDIWAFGVVVYALLTNTLPFNHALNSRTAEKIAKGAWDIDLVRQSKVVQSGSIGDVQALLEGCLHMDVSKRWSARDILGCAWLREYSQKIEMDVEEY